MLKLVLQTLDVVLKNLPYEDMMVCRTVNAQFAHQISKFMEAYQPIRILTSLYNMSNFVEALKLRQTEDPTWFGAPDRFRIEFFKTYSVSERIKFTKYFQEFVELYGKKVKVLHAAFEQDPTSFSPQLLPTEESNMHAQFILPDVFRILRMPELVEVLFRTRRFITIPPQMEKLMSYSLPNLHDLRLEFHYGSRDNDTSLFQLVVQRAPNLRYVRFTMGHRRLIATYAVTVNNLLLTMLSQLKARHYGIDVGIWLNVTSLDTRLLRDLARIFHIRLIHLRVLVTTRKILSNPFCKRANYKILFMLLVLEPWSPEASVALKLWLVRASHTLKSLKLSVPNSSDIPLCRFPELEDISILFAQPGLLEQEVSPESFPSLRKVRICSVDHRWRITAPILSVTQLLLKYKPEASPETPGNGVIPWHRAFPNVRSLYMNISSFAREIQREQMKMLFNGYTLVTKLDLCQFHDQVSNIGPFLFKLLTGYEQQNVLQLTDEKLREFKPDGVFVNMKCEYTLSLHIVIGI